MLVKIEIPKNRPEKFSEQSPLQSKHSFVVETHKIALQLIRKQIYMMMKMPAIYSLIVN